eukprot:s1920_g3.t1
MMVTMRLLLLAFAPLLASARGAEEPQERQLRKKDPGLQMRLSQHALDYMTQELLPKVLKSLSDVELSKVASGTYSNIDYRIWNVKINEIGVSKPGMTFHSPSGIELCLKGITANVSSAWFARWLFLTDAGRDGQVCASIELHTRKGQPKIKVAQLDVDLRLGPVSFTHSNLNWVMNVGAWLFQSQLEDGFSAVEERSTLELFLKRLQELASDTIRDQVSAVVRSDLSRALDKLDLNVVNDSIAVDLGVQSIDIMSNFLQVDIRGATSLVNHTDRVCPFPPEPFSSDLPSTWSSRMVSMAASKRTVECFLWLVNSTGMLSYTLWPAGVPDNPLGLKLDTEFMSLLAPGLKEVYPDKQWLLVEAEVGSEMPVFDFKAGAMDIKVPMIFSFRRLVKPGYYYNTSEFVFSLTADVLGRADLLIEPGKGVGQPQRLKAHATLMGASNLQQGTSKAGPVNLMMASQLLAVVRQPAEDPQLRDPNGAFMLSNVNTNISSGGVYFLSDLTMNWTWDRQKVMSLINGVSSGTQQPAAVCGSRVSNHRIALHSPRRCVSELFSEAGVASNQADRTQVFSCREKGRVVEKKGQRLARRAVRGEEVLTIVNGEIMARSRVADDSSMVVRQEQAY